MATDYKLTQNGIADDELALNPAILYRTGPAMVPRSAKALAYGGMAFQPHQPSSDQLYRLERGYPYKRAGRMAPVFPQFRTQEIIIQSLQSQPSSNNSTSQIITPTANANTTVSNQGSPRIGWPGGANRLNLA